MKLNAMLELWKYKWERRKLDKGMRRVKAESRQKNDDRIYEDWYAEHRWKFDLNEAHQERIITLDLVRRAEKLNITVPPQTDDSKWEEGIDNTVFLTPQGMRELRAAVRKAHRESVEWWLKIVGGTIAIVTGLFVLHSYLSPAPKSSEPKGSSSQSATESNPKPIEPERQDSAEGKDQPHAAKPSPPATRAGALSKPQNEPKPPASTFLGAHNPTETVVIPPNSDAIISSGQVAPEDMATLNRMKEEHVQAEAHLKSDPDKLILHDLFLTDFSSGDTTSTNRGGFTLRNDETGSLTHIEYIVIRQLATGNKFLKFYVLYTNETQSICESLATRFKAALDDFLEGRVEAQKTPGDSEQITSKDLVFSNRIFIYHETYLSPEQIIAVREAYKRQGITVILRSTDYLENEKLRAKVKQLEKTR